MDLCEPRSIQRHKKLVVPELWEGVLCNVGHVTWKWKPNIPSHSPVKAQRGTMVHARSVRDFLGPVILVTVSSSKIST